MAQKKKIRKKVSGDPRARLFRKMFSRIVTNQKKEDAEIDRLNNLVLGHADHKERLMLTFDPILQWLDALEKTGEIEFIGNIPILHTPNHCSNEKFFQLDEAIIAVADVYELIAKETGIEDKSDDLRRLGRKVTVGMMLFESDLKAAREAIAWMVDLTRTRTPLEMQEFTNVITVRALIHEQNKLEHRNVV